MAKSLKTLIRVCEWKVDQQRRELGLKLTELSVLETKLEKLQNELIKEQEFSEKNPVGGGVFYASYGMGVIRKQRLINKEKSKLELEVELIREDLNIAYNELKKYEMVSENRAQEERRKIERDEQIILDDLGIEKIFRVKK